jgi:hypothetical protein
VCGHGILLIVGLEEVDEATLVVLLEEVVVMSELVMLETDVDAIPVLIQEQALDILVGNPEHAIIHAGIVLGGLPSMYVEQNGAASADARIMARCLILEKIRKGSC